MSTTAFASEDHINFVLWNADANGIFDYQLWTDIITSQHRDAITLVARPEAGAEQIRRTVQAANKRVPETVVVVTKNELNVGVDEFETSLDNFEQRRGEYATFLGSEVVVSEPGCRVFQTVMQPTDYAPYTHMFTTPEYRAACYTATINAVFERDASGVDGTAEAAQDLMPSAYSMGWKFIDLDDPDKQAIRKSKSFEPGEQILFETTLDYLRRAGAGAPGATIKVQLGLDIVNVETGARTVIETLKIYEYEVSHRVPIDANYFRNFFRAGIDLKDPGQYRLTYRFTDLNAPEDKRTPAEIVTEVVIESRDR